MKMHDDLIHRILRYAEKHADGGITRCIPEFPCYDENEIDYHLQLCEEAGYLRIKVTGTFIKTGKDANSIIQLTWLGQSYLRELDQE